MVAASPIDGERCLILLNRAASKQNVFENLLCVDRGGKVAWKAELFDKYPDSFVEFKMTADGLHAWTWSCYHLRLDPVTGKTIERQFTK